MTAAAYQFERDGHLDPGDTQPFGVGRSDIELVDSLFRGKTLILVTDTDWRLLHRIGNLTGGTIWDRLEPGDPIELSSACHPRDQARVADLVRAAAMPDYKTIGVNSVSMRLADGQPLTGLHRMTIEPLSDFASAEGMVIRVDRFTAAEERGALMGRFDRVQAALASCAVADLTSQIASELNDILQLSIVDYVELELRAQSGRGRMWKWNRSGGAIVVEMPRVVYATHAPTPEPGLLPPTVWIDGVSTGPCPIQPSFGTVVELAETMGSGLLTGMRLATVTPIPPESDQHLLERAQGLFRAFQPSMLRIGTDKIAIGERHRAELIFKQLTDFVMVWNAEGQLMFATNSLADALGIEPQEIPGRSFSSLVASGDEIFAGMSKLGEGESGPKEQWVLRSGSHMIVVEASTTNLCHDEYVTGYMTTARDLTERMRSTVLDQRRNRLSTTVATISSRFVNATTSSTSTVVRTALADVSRCCQVERILLWQRQIDGVMRITHEHAQPGVQPIGGVAPGLDATALAECLDGALRGEPELCIDGQQGSAFVHLIEANSSRKLGAVLVVGLRGDDGLSGLLTCSAEYSPDGTIPALQELRAADIQATMRTVGELIASVLNRASAQEALTFSALHDPLTGLANRRLLLERAERMLRTAHRRANGIGLLFLDLDDFKTVNDTLGHDAGDELLCDVATRLRRLATGSTVVARLGGDEFVLLIEAPDPDAAVTRLGSQVINELSTLFSIRGRQLAVRVSIGASTVAPGKTQNQAASDLVRRADMAMYQAKRRGGSSFELFSEWLEDQVRRKFNLHEELREAIATDQLELWFQPQIKLATNTVIGCEALVRWRHPQKGFILPNDFIGVAEQAGLINDLGDWVFRKATEGLVRLRSAGLADDSFSVAVNVSPLQLIDADLVTRFETMASTAGVSPTQLTIELTESTLAERDRVIPNLTALRAAGFRTSIDDFGTGFSSLSYLRDLPLDEMKIDRSFIQSLGQDRRDLDMVWALVEMGHSLGLSVVAEGVETDTQRVLLDNMGCNIGQGWLFAKAMPVDQLTTFIAGWGQVSTSASSLAVS